MPVLAVATILNIAAYVLSRTQYFQLGAGIIIIEPLIGVPSSILSRLDADALAAGPIWLGLGPIISSLVLSTRFTVIFILATFTAFATLWFKIPGTFHEALLVQFVYVMASSVLALVGRMRFDRANRELEIERAKSVQSSKLASLGEMAGGIAHELNTPLAALLLTVDVVDELLANADQQVSEKLANCRNIINRMSAIIKGLKTFARDASIDPLRKCEDQTWIRDALNLCQQRIKVHGIELIMEEKSSGAIIEARPVQLTQVLVNLLNNSADAIDQLSEKWIRITVEENSGFLEVAVEDSGQGIARQDQEKIFQPFFTTKDIGSGTGLGLSISKEILLQHQGDLLYQQIGSHTRFLMKIPLINSGEKEPAA